MGTSGARVLALCSVVAAAFTPAEIETALQKRRRNSGDMSPSASKDDDFDYNSTNNYNDSNDDDDYNVSNDGNGYHDEMQGRRLDTVTFTKSTTTTTTTQTLDATTRTKTFTTTTTQSTSMTFTTTQTTTTQTTSTITLTTTQTMTTQTASTLTLTTTLTTTTRTTSTITLTTTQTTTTQTTSTITFTATRTTTTQTSTITFMTTQTTTTQTAMMITFTTTQTTTTRTTSATTLTTTQTTTTQTASTITFTTTQTPTTQTASTTTLTSTQTTTTQTTSTITLTTTQTETTQTLTTLTTTHTTSQTISTITYTTTNTTTKTMTTTASTTTSITTKTITAVTATISTVTSSTSTTETFTPTTTSVTTQSISTTTMTTATLTTTTRSTVTITTSTKSTTTATTTTKSTTTASTTTASTTSATSTTMTTMTQTMTTVTATSATTTTLPTATTTANTSTATSTNTTTTMITTNTIASSATVATNTVMLTMTASTSTTTIQSLTNTITTPTTTISTTTPTTTTKTSTLTTATATTLSSIVTLFLHSPMTVFGFAPVAVEISGDLEMSVAGDCVEFMSSPAVQAGIAESIAVVSGVSVASVVVSLSGNCRRLSGLEITRRLESVVTAAYLIKVSADAAATGQDVLIALVSAGKVGMTNAIADAFLSTGIIEYGVIVLNDPAPTAFTATTTTTTHTTPTHTTTTRTTTTRTKTTHTTTTTLNRVDVAVALVEQQETLMVKSLLAGNETQITMTVDGAKVVAQKLSVEASPEEGYLDVLVEDSPVMVEVPAGLVKASGGDLVIAISAFEPSTVSSLQEHGDSAGDTDAGSSGAGASAARRKPPVQVMAAVSITFSSASSGAKLEMQALPEPMLLTLPTNRSSGAQCAYWNSHEKRWSSAGVSTVVGNADSLMVCSVTHLTLFAAIIRGAVSSMICSQALLFSKEARRDFLAGQWFKDVGAMALWALLSVLMALFMIAVLLDCYRYHKGYWIDADFLIPVNSEPSPASDEAGVEPEGEPEREPEGEPEGDVEKRGYLTSIVLKLCVAAALLQIVYTGIRSISGKIASRAFEYYGDVHHFFRGLCSGGDEGGSYVLLQGLAFTLLRHSCHRAAYSAHWIRHRDIDAIWKGMRDKSITANNHSGSTSFALDASGPVRIGTSSVSSRQSQRRETLLTKLRSEVSPTVEQHYEAMAHWRHFPRIVARLFATQMPVGSVLVYSISRTSSMRVLFLGCQVLGGCAINVFFASARSKTNDPAACDVQDIWEKLGRLIAKGIVSAVFCTVPVAIFSSLHVRKFQEVDFEESRQWKRQLLVWRRRDRVLWILGFTYILFCIQYCFLFFASVTSDDQSEWILSVAIQLIQMLIILPIALSVGLPLFAAVVLRISSALGAGSKHQLIAAIVERDGRIEPSLRFQEKHWKGTDDMREREGESMEHLEKAEAINVQDTESDEVAERGEKGMEHPEKAEAITVQDTELEEGQVVLEDRRIPDLCLEEEELEEKGEQEDTSKDVAYRQSSKPQAEEHRGVEEKEAQRGCLELLENENGDAPLLEEASLPEVPQSSGHLPEDGSSPGSSCAGMPKPLLCRRPHKIFSQEADVEQLITAKRLMNLGLSEVVDRGPRVCGPACVNPELGIHHKYCPEHSVNQDRSHVLGPNEEGVAEVPAAGILLPPSMAEEEVQSSDDCDSVAPVLFRVDRHQQWRHPGEDFHS